MSFRLKSILKKAAVCLMPVLLMSTYAAPIAFAENVPEYSYKGSGDLDLDKDIAYAESVVIKLGDNTLTNGTDYDLTGYDSSGAKINGAEETPDHYRATLLSHALEEIEGGSVTVTANDKAIAVINFGTVTAKDKAIAKINFGSGDAKAVSEGDSEKVEEETKEKIIEETKEETTEETEEETTEETEEETEEEGKSRAISTGDASFVLQSVAGLISTGLGLFVIRRKINK